MSKLIEIINNAINQEFLNSNRNVSIEVRLYRYVLRLLETPSILFKSYGELAAILNLIRLSPKYNLNPTEKDQLEKEITGLTLLPQSARMQIRMELLSRQIRKRAELFQVLSNIMEKYNKLAQNTIQNIRG